MQKTNELMTAKDVAARARVSIDTFYRWCGTGRGPPAIHLGGAIRYRPSDVDKWLEDHLRAKR